MGGCVSCMTDETQQAGSGQNISASSQSTRVARRSTKRRGKTYISGLDHPPAAAAGEAAYFPRETTQARLGQHNSITEEEGEAQAAIKERNELELRLAFASRVRDQDAQTAVPQALDQEVPTSTMNDDEDEELYWLSKAEDHEESLRDAPLHIQNNKLVVITAVRRHGLALQFATPKLKDDIDVVYAAIRQDINAFQWASEGVKRNNDIKDLVQQCSKIYYDYLLDNSDSDHNLRNEKSVAMEAVQENGFALENVSPRLQNDRQVVLAAVRKNGGALGHASPELQGDRQVVMDAVNQDGTALEFAAPDLQGDKQIVMTAVQNDKCGLALKYAPEFQGDKEVALAAVKQNPDAIRYIDPILKMDPDILIASCMFGGDHVDAIARRVMGMSKIVLSTRFSLNQDSWSCATQFTALFRKSQFITSCPAKFDIYAPNANNKNCCDPIFTDFNHPCRGTKGCCQFKNVHTDDGRPTNDCCWRYSYRSQLQEAKDTGGFMLQIVETGKDFGTIDDATLGMGQTIELDMAHAVGTKVFQVYRPSSGKYEQWFQKSHIDVVTAEISRWYENQFKDMSVIEIRPQWRV